MQKIVLALFAALTLAATATAQQTPATIFAAVDYSPFKNVRNNEGSARIYLSAPIERSDCTTTTNTVKHTTSVECEGTLAQQIMNKMIELDRKVLDIQTFAISTETRDGRGYIFIQSGNIDFLVLKEDVEKILVPVGAAAGSKVEVLGHVIFNP